MNHSLQESKHITHTHTYNIHVHTLIVACIYFGDKKCFEPTCQAGCSAEHKEKVSGVCLICETCERVNYT